MNTAPICQGDTCSVADSALPSLDRDARATRKVEVVSDLICPWCYVAKKRLDQALDRLDPRRESFQVSWSPFELNPDMRMEGKDRRAYRSAKFGSWEHSRKLDEQVKHAAQGEIEFHHELMARTPNTLNAHRLIDWAGRQGDQNRLVEALFEAYFVKGRDVGDLGTLADIAQSSGLSRDAAFSYLVSNEGIDEIRGRSQEARASGITGVPSVFLDGQFWFSGAQPESMIFASLQQAAS